MSIYIELILKMSSASSSKKGTPLKAKGKSAGGTTSGSSASTGGPPLKTPERTFAEEPLEEIRATGETPIVDAPFVYFRVSRDPPGPHTTEVKKIPLDQNGLPQLDKLDISLIAKAWHEEHAELMANSTMQFVSTVAGFLDDPAEKLLYDEFSKLIPFFNSYKTTFANIELPKQAGKQTVGRLEQLVEKVQELNKNRAVEFHKLWFTASTLQDIYFSPVLSAQCRQGVDKIRSLHFLLDDYDALFYYLIRNVHWMPRFARLVAAGINLVRRRKYIYTKAFQMTAAEEEYTNALQAFQLFQVREPILQAEPNPDLRYKQQYLLESKHPVAQLNFREDKYANVNI